MKLPYQQVSIELDKLYFGPEPAEERAAIIEEFLIATGWNWDDILSHIIGEADFN